MTSPDYDDLLPDYKPLIPEWTDLVVGILGITTFIGAIGVGIVHGIWLPTLPATISLIAGYFGLRAYFRE